MLAANTPVMPFDQRWTSPPYELMAFAAIALLIARECRQLFRRYHRLRGYNRTEAWLVILVLAGSVAYYTDVLVIPKHITSALKLAEGSIAELQPQAHHPRQKVAPARPQAASMT